ncbi:non-ribosomal peptide synthetase [Candidatus Methylobacter oryzae]|uniref:Amino acid adenylation domain-containing protein n=1 Tax=Candidatus Methylobacter oryzae TaxID=2497749 RepID=A0ABY3C5C5_9GAMM|nr:non-ribosomal peptide synthetase [Candidatus Methylobacter oryzae]TRW90218.1 amino acid adenylation domain-containing protein [Candidatus Methylobacter oryzae]
MHSSSIITTLQQAQADQRKPILNRYIRELLADFLGMDGPEDIAPTQSFIELGTDSLQAVEFKTKLESSLGCSLRTTLLFDRPSLDLLVDYLIDDILPLEQMQAKQAVAGTRQRLPSGAQPIAIIGLAGCFPGADSAELLWRKAMSGECLQSGHEIPELAFGYGRIDDGIDASIAERQLQLLARLIGQVQDDYRISRQMPMTGVFIAAQSFADCSNCQPYRVPIANQLSFQLDLKGPSEVINTFCTSVHVALHHAVQSIRSGECEQAIVGAVNLIDADEFASLARQGFYDALLTRGNLTRSFSEDADGFVRSEGAGVAMLKSLERALADGNRILAIVKSSAIHHGGRGYSLEAPNVQGLKQAIIASISQAGIGTDTIDYVEAHGIGNTLADALELTTISDVYRLLSANPDKNWFVGSVKPSIGHPEVASGMASLIKAVKALEHRAIPGIAGLGEINRELPADHALILQNQSTDWQHSAGPRRVALNSYAIGGVNAHIVLEEYCGQTLDDAATVVSQRSSEATQTAGLSGAVEAALADLVADVFGIDLTEIDRTLSPVHYGFDSIQVVQFIKRLNERLGLSIKVAQAMGANNFGEFFDLLARQTPGSNRTAPQTPAIVPAGPQPLSETQKGLWYIQQTFPESTAFNVPLIFRLKAPADPDCLCEALLAVLEERPLLRCRFKAELSGLSAQTKLMPSGYKSFQENIVQTVGTAAGNLAIEHLCLSCDQPLSAFLRQLLHRSFNLETDPPLRLYTVECPDDQRYYAFFVIHHIVIDGFSGMLFANEFWGKYHALAAGKTVNKQTPDTAFFDFIAWERAYLDSPRAEADLAWWKERLDGVSASIALPYDTLPQPGLAEQGMGCETLTLDRATLAALKYLGATLNQNLSALLLGVFNLLIHRLSAADDIAVNMPAAGRPLLRHENTLGCYINLMIIRTQIREDDSFLQLVKQIGSNLAESLDHSHYPFARLMPELGLTLLNQSDVPFSVSFTYQNIFDSILESEQQLGSVELCYDVYQQTMDSYMLEVYDFRDKVELHLKYQRNLFEADTVRRHLGYLETLIAAISEDPGRRIADYDCLPDQELSLLLEDFNDTAAEFAGQSSFYELFEAGAAQFPDNTAVIFAGQALSYAELAERSRQLAVYLQAGGIGADKLIAVCMDRSADMIVAVLGVLGSGAAYLPIDPHNGEDRIRYMLNDGNVGMLLTQAHLQPALEVYGCRTLAVDRPVPASDTELRREAGPQHPAYVIYTSGSTGKPKGVVISQRSLLNLCHAMTEQYGITERDRILQFASLSFDMSVEEIFPYLLAGAGVVIRRDDDIEVDNFYRLVVDNGVSILNLPPQFYSVIAALEPERQQRLFSQLRLISFGGEALPDATLQAVQNRGVRIFNAYGPTECTVNAAIAELGGGRRLSIGKPVANTRLYVLGKHLELQPIGVAGELHIGGEGLALGYLNNPELTAEKFIDNPYAPGKLYKTGDLARWLPDGTIAYLGRTDDQVKIRGFRVELGEIENALAALPGVTSAAVVVAGERLVAYYASDAAGVDAEALREPLRRCLPDYMVPAAFVCLQALPLTANGKIDRKQLQRMKPEFDAGEHYAAPQTPVERQLARIWEDVLALDRVGLNDNFFELGGHSLLSIQLVHEINRQLPSSRIGITDIIQCPTVRELAGRIGDVGDKPGASPYVANLRDSIPTFIVPGMPGLSDGYHQLAALIGGCGPVYGLQMQGYNGSVAAASVEDMAAHNIALIRGIKARGAIKLYAHSYGGTVAYEMLKQLQHSEISVDALVLIDCGVANWPKQLDKPAVVGFCRMIFDNAGSEFSGQAAAIEAILDGNPYPAWKSGLAKLLHAAMGIAPGYFLDLWNVVETSLAVDYRYPHGKLPCRPTLVIAEESRSWLKPDCWDDYYDGVNVVHAGGGHFSIVAEPYCSAWIKEIGLR